MKLFQRFFSPKWKNKNPDIRKQALIALSRDDNQDIFSEIVNIDEITELRQLAVKRINSFDTLISIAANNSDPKVQIIANKIISQMLAGSSANKQQNSQLSQQERINKINSLDTQLAENQKILELIAENGDSTEIRITAIEHVNRESLLGNILIKESDNLIKKHIAEKLSQKSTLERVLKAIKNKDKQTSKIIKTKLDQLIAKEEEPKVILAKQKTLCLNIEQLGKKGLWERDKIQFDHIKTQWQELSASLLKPDQDDNKSSLSLDAKLENRFNTATQLFQDNYNSYLSRNEARLKQEAELLPLKEEKQALITQLHQLLSQANEKTFKNNHNDLVNDFSSAQKKWHLLNNLPDDIEKDLIKQYQDVSNSLKSFIKDIESETKANAAISTLLSDVKYAVKHSHKISPIKINALEKKLQHISAPATATAEIKLLIEKAKLVIEKNKAKASEIFANTQSFINVLETALDEGEIKTANDTQKTIQANIKKLEKLGHNKLVELKQEDLTLSEKLAELNKWRSWANTPQKERLISEMTALIDSDMDPKEVAFLVSKARKDWQQLGPSDQSSSQAMWGEFSAACDAAYEPCKVVFEEEAKARTENYTQRIAFLENLESFIDNANWQEVNWVKVENLFQQARREWQNLGIVDKNKRKGINARFNKFHHILKDKLSQEWAENEKTKQNIVNQSQELIELEDLNAAINSAKDLQQQWKTAGRIQRQLENKLWATFRENCDKIFARRESINKQKKDDEKELIIKTESLCTELETLCNKPAKEIDQFSESIVSLKKQITELSKDNDKPNKEVSTRISQALTIFDIKKETAIRIKQVSSLAMLRKKVNFLEKIENSVSSLPVTDLESLTTELKSMNSLLNSDWEDVLINRFSNLNSIENAEQIFQNSDSNLRTIKASTISLEIIAEVDTPSDDAAERLKIQTERLSNKLNNHDEKNQWDAFISLEAKWQLNGPVKAPELKHFEDRHKKVINELKQQYAIELEDY